MKLNGIGGTGSGKLGAQVWSVNSGEQVVRQYQSKVTNPSTPAQVNQRARLKLMSQLAAALAPVIVIPKQGMVSARNRFISKNFDYVVATDGTAQVTYENLQMTAGNVGLPSISATRAEGATTISVSLSAAPASDISRVVYAMFKKTQGQLEYVASRVVTNRGESNNFPASFPVSSGDIVLYAYGMKDLNSNASAKFANYNVATASDIARLVATRSIAVSDFSFTQTRGTTIYSGETGTTEVPDGQARVFVTAAGPGTVTGAGTYAIGSTVLVQATPNEGAVFNGWRLQGLQTIVSNNERYEFTLTEQTDLIAMFSAEQEDGPNEN